MVDDEKRKSLYNVKSDPLVAQTNALPIPKKTTSGPIENNRLSVTPPLNPKIEPPTKGAKYNPNSKIFQVWRYVTSLTLEKSHPQICPFQGRFPILHRRGNRQILSQH